MFFIICLVLILIAVLLVYLLYRWVLAKKTITETASELRPDEQVDVGNIGVSITVLRPIGKAKFNGKTYIVEANNEWIESDTKIKIISIQGNTITVEGI